MAVCKVKEFNDLPAVLNAPDVAAVMGISIPNAYLLFKRAGFPSIRVSDKRIVVARDKFLEWLDRESDRQIV